MKSLFLLLSRRIYSTHQATAMLDFDVQRCTRRCAKTDEEFAAGDTFYSVLVADGQDVVRYDYCEQAWEGPPEISLGWWKSTMPDSHVKKMNWAPNDVLMHYFEQTADQDENADLRYVLALLLVRRKIAKIDETMTNEHGQDVMKVYCPRKEVAFDVIVASPTAERVSEIQAELAKLLFADAS